MICACVQDLGEDFTACSAQDHRNQSWMLRSRFIHGLIPLGFYSGRNIKSSRSPFVAGI